MKFYKINKDIFDYAFYNVGLSCIQTIYEIIFYKDIMWHRDGDKPAICQPTFDNKIKYVEYYKNNYLHRELGPAIMYKYTYQYFLFGECYKEFKNSLLSAKYNKEYYV